MSARCLDVEEALSAYMDGQEAPEETIAVRTHLESCAACRQTLAAWETITVDVDAPVLDLPERVAARLPHRAVRHRGWTGKLLLAAAILGMAVGSSVLAGVARKNSSPEPAAGPNTSAKAPGEARPASSGDKTTAVVPPAGADAGTSSEETPQPKPTTRPPSAGQPGSARVSDHELALGVGVDRTMVRASEPVNAAFFLQNIVKYDVTFQSARESVFDLVVTDTGGNEVFRRSNAWKRDPVTRTLKAGQSMKETFTFNAPARAGGYLVHAECICLRSTRTTAPTDTAPSRESAGKMLITPSIKFSVGK